MVIGFDAKRAAQNRTGLGNYSRFVLQSLDDWREDDACKYVLYTPNSRRTDLLQRFRTNDHFCLKFPTTRPWTWFKSLWRVWGVTSELASDGVQLFHGLSNELPLNIRKACGVKSIVTIHDLIFLRYPHCYKLIDRLIYNYKFKKACQQADRIIAVSECTKNDIISFYHIPEQKIEVIYQGCDPAFSIKVSEEKKREVAEKYHLPDRFVLYVGSIEERKNLLLLAKALKSLPSSISVVAVGRRTAYADLIDEFLKDADLTSRMKLISGVPFADLPALYQMATLFVYPSRFEGFGIPLLEALCSGTPVVGCTGSCLEEAGGPDSIYVDPDNEVELAEVIQRIWNDGELRLQMIESGKRYAENFHPQVLAAQMWDCYHRTIKGSFPPY